MHSFSIETSKKWPRDNIPLNTVIQFLRIAFCNPAFWKWFVSFVVKISLRGFFVCVVNAQCINLKRDSYRATKISINHPEVTYNLNFNQVGPNHFSRNVLHPTSNHRERTNSDRREVIFNHSLPRPGHCVSGPVRQYHSHDTRSVRDHSYPRSSSPPHAGDYFDRGDHQCRSSQSTIADQFPRRTAQGP